MESYEKVLKTTKEAKTLADHIKALGKIRGSGIEDKDLFDKINLALESLQDAHLNSKKGKSTPILLDNAPGLRIKALIDYCKKAVATKKPEWQIIAEKHGWAPKT